MPKHFAGWRPGEKLVQQDEASLNRAVGQWGLFLVAIPFCWPEPGQDTDILTR